MKRVNALERARVTLEAEMGFPVASSDAPVKKLLAFPKSKADRKRVADWPTWAGFPVEVRRTPKAL